MTFSMFLIIWLAVGFLVGIKFIYVDKELNEENLNESVSNMREKGKNPSPNAIKMAGDKRVVLAMNTIAGFYSLYSHIKAIVKKRKKK